MKVLGEKNVNGQSFFHVINTENDTFIHDYKTAEQIHDQSILYQFYSNRNNNQLVNDNPVSCPKMEESNQFIKEDQLFFSQFRNSGVNFSADLSVESVIPITTPAAEIKLMVPCNNDYVFVNPEYIEQINSEKYKLLFQKLINTDQKLEDEK